MTGALKMTETLPLTDRSRLRRMHDLGRFDVATIHAILDAQPLCTVAYVRDGNNLVYTHKISLSDALTDCSLQIPTLDNRVISVACPEVVSPFYEKTVGGEGMPISKKPGQKGDMVVKFHILFPKYLNGQKRTKIRELLAGEELLN